MIKILISTLAAVLLAALILGGEKMWSYVRGGGEVLNAQLDSSTPLALEVARIRVLIETQGERIQKFDDTLLDLQGRSDAAARTVSGIQQRLDGEKKLLEQVKTMLDRGQTTYLVGDRGYSFAEVNADAMVRLDSCKRMQEELLFQTSLQRDLDAAVEQGRRNMVDARRQYGELKNQLARLGARDANADVRLEVASLTGALAGALPGPSSELERAFLNLERRVAVKERRVSVTVGGVRGNALIDYSPTLITEDASQQIGQFLAVRPEPVEPLTSTTRPAQEMLSPVVSQ